MLQHEKFQSAPGSRVGTPAYLAPEVILTTKGKTYDGKVMLVVALLTFDALLTSAALTHTLTAYTFMCTQRTTQHFVR